MTQSTEFTSIVKSLNNVRRVLNSLHMQRDVGNAPPKPQKSRLIHEAAYTYAYSADALQLITIISWFQLINMNYNFRSNADISIERGKFIESVDQLFAISRYT